MRKKKLTIQIDKDKCIGCGFCVKKCSKLKLSGTNGQCCADVAYPKLCSGCGACMKVCPSSAITLIEQTNNKPLQTMKKIIFKFTIKFVLAVAGFGLVTMLLWNALLPDIFGVAPINIWQAFGLLILTRLLFGGMCADAMMHKHHGHFHRTCEKWKKMTPEQRQEFIQKRRHFSFEHPFGREMNEHEKPEKENDQAN